MSNQIIGNYNTLILPMRPLKSVSKLHIVHQAKGLSKTFYLVYDAHIHQKLLTSQINTCVRKQISKEVSSAAAFAEESVFLIKKMPGYTGISNERM